MAIDILCPGCGRTLRIGEQHAGRQVRCPACQHVAEAPAAAAMGELRPAAMLAKASASWHMRTPEGSTYGPANWEEVSAWASEGRIAADCELGHSALGPWQRASELFPALKIAAPPAAEVRAPPSFAWSAADKPAAELPAADKPAAGWGTPGSGSPFAAPAGSAVAGYVLPHRGGLILVLALLGFVIGCPIFSLLAWVMGSNDLREIRAGRMDRSGEGLTQVGQILGMVQSLLWIASAVILLGMVLLFAVARF